MKNLQRRREAAFNSRQAPRFNPRIKGSIAERGVGMVAASKKVGEGPARKSRHVIRFVGAAYVRQIKQAVDAVTVVAEEPSPLFSTEARIARGSQTLRLTKTAAGEALLRACQLPFCSIRLQYLASAFHPFFNLLEGAISKFGVPTITASRQITQEECDALNRLAAFVKHRAIGNQDAKFVDCDSEDVPPIYSDAYRRHGVQRTAPGAQLRLREAVRKNSNDVDRFLDFLGAEAHYKLVCFTGTRADSDASCAALRGEAWDANTFAAELKVFDARRKLFVRRLCAALSKETTAEKIRGLWKTEFCLAGGLRLLLAIVIPPTCGLSAPSLSSLVDEIWTGCSRQRSSIAELPFGVDSTSPSCSGRKLTLRARILDRFVHVDELVRLDVRWLAQNSAVGLSTSTKTVGRFAA